MPNRLEELANSLGPAATRTRERRRKPKPKKLEMPISELMRRAKTVAVKLDRKDAQKWFECEIAGYRAAARSGR